MSSGITNRNEFAFFVSLPVRDRENLQYLTGQNYSLGLILQFFLRLKCRPRITYHRRFRLALKEFTTSPSKHGRCIQNRYYLGLGVFEQVLLLKYLHKSKKE
jgi:hypothetical protein